MEKAKYFSETRVIPGLDLAASVAKSDTLIDEDLKLELRSAVQELKAHQASSPDWHPWSNDTVQDLVHPSLYPLVYGRSRVFGDEVVGIEDAVEKWAGKGEIITAKEGEMKTWDIEYDLREFCKPVFLIYSSESFCYPNLATKLLTGCTRQGPTHTSGFPATFRSRMTEVFASPAISTT